MSPRLRAAGVLAERLARGCFAVFALAAVASVSLQNFAYLSLAAWMAAWAWKRQVRPVRTPLDWPLLLLAAVLVLASVAAGQVNGSWFGIRKVGIMAIFFLTVSLADHPLRARRSLDFFLAGGGICALGSILLFGLGIKHGRATSFSGDYMAAGGMYMLCFLLAVSRFLQPSAGRGRRIWGAVALVLALALVMTYTRSSWIGALAGLLFLGLYRDWRLPAAVLLLVAGFLAVFPHSPVAERAWTVNSNISSNTERRLMWDTGLKLFRDAPWLGYGVDNLARVYGRYVHPEAEEQSPPHVHNTLLQLALNGGAAASLVYVVWLIAVWRLGLLGFRRLPDSPAARDSLGITAAMIGFAVNGLFEFNFGTAQVMAIVYFLTGLLPALARKSADTVPLPENPALLFIRPRFRGDVLLASLVPQWVKRERPGARVDLLTEPESLAVAQGEPLWDRVLSLPRRGGRAWRQTVGWMRAQSYDAVIDLFGNPRSALLTGLSGAAWKIGPDARFWGQCYTVKTRPPAGSPVSRPAWDAYADAVRSLGLKPGSQRPRWRVTPEDEAWVRDWLRLRKLSRARLLGIFPGGSHPAKRWPFEKFLQTARLARTALGVTPIFVFGPAEADLRRLYSQAREKQSWVLDSASPGQLAALWARSAAVLSNDAFPLHLGPAVNTPTLGLFGPGEPEIWFPYGTTHRMLQDRPACWPCHRDACRTLECWETITPERVVRTLAEMAGTRSKRPVRSA